MMDENLLKILLEKILPLLSYEKQKIENKSVAEQALSFVYDYFSSSIWFAANNLVTLVTSS